SIWYLDDIKPLRQMSTAVLEKDLHLFESKRGTNWRRINTGRKQPSFMFRGKNPPGGAGITFWLKEDAGIDARITISNIDGSYQQTITAAAEQGLNRTHWTGNFAPNEADIKAYEHRLLNVLTILGNDLKDPLLLKELEGLQKEIKGETNFRVLNEIRGKMVEQFGTYAKGQAIFGPKLKEFSAPAGQYKVKLMVGKFQTEGVLEWRDDPMMEEHGWKK
ncbi:MAG: hypothetical protein AAF705_11650, partial [Bacteroidota bacterium]